MSIRYIRGAHLPVQSILQLVLEDCIPAARAVRLRPQIRNFVSAPEFPADWMVDLAASLGRQSWQRSNPHQAEASIRCYAP